MNIEALNESKNLLRENKLEREQNLQIENVKSEFSNIVRNVVDKGANYVIKAMPCNEHIKDILIDVKSSFKTKNFKDILNTAINSSIREGLEVLSLPKNVLKDINKVKEISLKGGLSKAISAGIEIVLSKKFNINKNITRNFIEKIKGFINNKAFITKIDQGIKKSISRVDRFKEMCNKWYEAYNNFNLEKINDISSKLKSSVKHVNYDKDSVKNNNIIQNLTEFVNNKKEKLTDMQYKACLIV